MERFTATAGELAAAPSTWALGYCHGSERAAMMRAIGAFRAAHPDAVVRADGLTSLRILDGVRAGTLAAGIVRGPVPDPDRVASKPLARVPVDHVAVPPRHPLAGADIVNAGDLDGEPVLVVDRAEAPTAHDEIEAYCAAAGARPQLDHPRRGPGRAGARPGRPRHRHRLAQRLAGRAGRRRPDVAVRPLRPVALFDTFQRRVASGRRRPDDRTARAGARRRVCVATDRR